MSTKFSKFILGIMGKHLRNMLPDALFLKMKFEATMGSKLHLDAPVTFNEKLQYLKLHDRNPRYTDMVDKAAAKEYAASLIGREHIVPTLGVWNSFDEIDFASLPQQFAMKCTHDSGGLVLCTDKAKFDIPAAKKKINASLKRNFYYSYREWPYKNVKPRILAEQFINEEKGTLTDYKFMCFNGEPEYVFVICRQSGSVHNGARLSCYTLDGKLVPFEREQYAPLGNDWQPPENFPEMIDMARKFSHDIANPFVRIDLYSISGQIFFSEITFYPGAGLTPFNPPEWDTILGQKINISPQNTQNTQK